MVFCLTRPLKNDIDNMKREIRVFCQGIECPVRNTCLRYTKYAERHTCGCEYQIVFKCRNQRHYLQDESRVNTDGEGHR